MVRVDSSATFSSSSLVTSMKVSVSTLYPLTISSLATSSPVSASTLAYLMRWPVFRLSWLKETFSDSEVAGYSATGQVTRERRRKPFQLARGAMLGNSDTDAGFKTNGRAWFRHRAPSNRRIFHGRASIGLDFRSLYVLIRNVRPTRELAHADPKADGKAGR